MDKGNVEFDMGHVVIVVSTGNKFSEVEKRLNFTVEEWRALSEDEQAVEIQYAIENAVEWEIKVK